jgi:Flp pilus assembly protein TadG
MAMTTCNHARNTAHKLAGRLRQERGQSLVEFAVVLPVLIAIILGIVYFGRYEDYANQETQLAETGVRWAAVGWLSSNYTMPSSCPAAGTGNNGATLQCYIRSQAQPELANGSSDVAKAQVWIYQPSSATSYAIGQPIRVCVLSTVTFPSPIGSPSVTMSQMGTMRIESVPAGFATAFPATPWDAGNPTGTRPSQCSAS